MSEKVLSKEQINAVRVGSQMEDDVLDSHEALRAERDALAAKMEAVIAPAEVGGGIEAHYKAERDAALAEVESLRDAIAWALGEREDFNPPPANWPRYWWRNELRKRAGIASAQKEGE